MSGKATYLEVLEILVLSDANLQIEREEFLAINNSSSSGQITPVNLIGSLDRYSEERIFVWDMDLNGIPGQKFDKFRDLKTEFVFRCFNLAPRLTAIQNVLLSNFASLRTGINPKKRARKPFEIVELHDHTRQRSRELSEGQFDRISTAHVLISDPTILLEDELIRGFDSKATTSIFQIVFHLNMKSRSLVTTVNNSEITKWVGSVFQIKDGITQYN